MSWAHYLGSFDELGDFGGSGRFSLLYNDITTLYKEGMLRGQLPQHRGVESLARNRLLGAVWVAGEIASPRG